MPQRQPGASVENNFTKGLLTEFTGLNFPENAATETFNCIFERTGEVKRRLGIDFETFAVEQTRDRAGKCISQYMWKNATGDGTKNLLVQQVGKFLYFYDASTDTFCFPLSQHAIQGGVAVLNLEDSLAPSAGPITDIECDYAAGLGFLFIFHPQCRPIFISYDGISSFLQNSMDLIVRDFKGLAESPAMGINERPVTLSTSHNYNLINQGWVNLPNSINIFFAQMGVYPSNSDIWYTFKDFAGVFNPGTTAANVEQPSTPAPSGRIIFGPFDEDRTNSSGVPGIPNVTTNKRPRTGAFFAGRLWFGGVDAVGHNNRLYFSQIIEGRDTAQFAKCHQTNDPTSDRIFDLLPTDGGVITIQGADTIIKLFPMLNNLLVFANNGIWQISGSQGLGFTATDYVVQKLDAIPSLSHTSFVDFKGTPMWWNANGIYTIVQDTQTGKLSAKSMTDTTIASFYEDIPDISKKYARGCYNKDNYIIQWLYKSTKAATIDENYNFDSILCFNTVTGAFYPWRVDSLTNPVKILGITVVDGEGGLGFNSDFLIPATFKYTLWNSQTGGISFGEEHNISYKDFELVAVAERNYNSYFVTGYKLHGDAQKKFQSPYVHVYNRIPEDVQYSFQAFWDYALTGDSGRTSLPEHVSFKFDPDFKYKKKRHKVRGQGHALQYKVDSVDNKGFYISGWSAWESKAAAQ